jgi:hypothetical protein
MSFIWENRENFMRLRADFQKHVLLSGWFDRGAMVFNILFSN